MLIGMLMVGGGQGALARQVLMLTADITGGNAERLGAIDAFTNTKAELVMVVGATNLTRMPVFVQQHQCHLAGNTCTQSL